MHSIFPTKAWRALLAGVVIGVFVSLGTLSLGQALDERTFSGYEPAQAVSEPSEATLIQMELASSTRTRTIPRCAEDEYYLIGQGAYNSETDRYERYECAHVDTIVGSVRNEPELARAFRFHVCENPRFWARNHGIDVMPEACP